MLSPIFTENWQPHSNFECNNEVVATEQDMLSPIYTEKYQNQNNFDCYGFGSSIHTPSSVSQFTNETVHGYTPPSSINLSNSDCAMLSLL